LTNPNIRNVDIVSEMKSSYMDYAMSVIVSRALPDIRDGLKPVHRRILYAMNDMGITRGSAHKKSARIVGEVLGKYHPHGDSSVYYAMVRMAQDFSMRYMLVDGQGNFGSVDNDPPAAMRYTEARLTAIAQEMLTDIDKDTVDFTPNFDDSLKEPTVLPSRIPNLLINGSSGIAVGMATSIPPHNLGEICDAACHLIDNPEASVEDLTQFVKGPDFPTAGIIQGREGIRTAYATGRGRIVVKARTEITEGTSKERPRIIVKELPYQTDKSALIQRIAQLVKDKKLDAISELRDESDRHGMRIMIELKRDAQPEKVLNNLYKHTAMQSAFFFNMLALVGGQPRVISLKEGLQYFIDFRQETITRRSQFELQQAQARAHILEGLKIALDNIDRVIATIRQSESAEVARGELVAAFGLTEIQAQAILDMQLRRLANLESQKILDEYTEVIKKINYLEDLLANPKKILRLVNNDMTEVKEKYGDKRRTQILQQEAGEFRDEDLIPHQQVVVTLSDRGYIKRVPAEAFRTQHRGGKGIIGMVTRDKDMVRMLEVADTHDTLLFFTNRGKVYSIRCYELPSDLSRTAKGTAVVNLFPVADNERVTAMLTTQKVTEDSYMVFGTLKGEVKKTRAANYANVRSSGIIAMDLEAKDELINVVIATDKDDIIMVTSHGQSIRFNISELRSSSRTSGGVIGIRLGRNDGVVSLSLVDEEAFLLTVTRNGHGKLTKMDNYPRQHRAGSGVITLKTNDKTGDVCDAKLVTQSQQLVIISAEGIVTRISVQEKDSGQGIPIYTRYAKGVWLMRPQPGDYIVAIANFEV
jgi:DNA gyrase subunit A